MYGVPGIRGIREFGGAEFDRYPHVGQRQPPKKAKAKQ
jgi:hypothetical protein